MKSKILVFILLFFTFSLNVNALEITSNNAILYNLNNDEIIYEKSKEEKIKIASLTKIMTTIVAIENIDDLNKEVIITNEMSKGLIERNAAVYGLQAGDVVTYKDLLYLTMLPSAADATQALAISITGSIDEFVNLMNEKAKSLGLVNTNFTNTHGLDDENNYSTVKDIAIILKYALNNDTFNEIFQTKYYTLSNNQKIRSTLESSSLKYNLDTSYIKGSKTGTTKKAGMCLASIASYNNINYLLVTAKTNVNLLSNEPLNIKDSDLIYKYYFENYNYYNILNENTILTKIDNKYSDKEIIITSPIEYSLYMLKEDYEKLEYEYIGKTTTNIFEKNKLLGSYNIKSNGEIIKTIDVYNNYDNDFNILIFISNYLYIFIPLIIILILISIKVINIRLKKI